MVARIAKLGGVLGIIALGLIFGPDSQSQTPSPQSGVIGESPMPVEPAGVPRGVEVQARGPVHEAFATPNADPKPTPTIAKKPPAPLEEMPPEEKPEGESSWIAGYWVFDDDRQDFLWVSGCWRVKPEGKDWVPGYWREQGDRWQWVSGFWTNTAAQGRKQEVTYYPEPPAPPQVAPPGDPPNADAFYVPGYQMWNGERYVWRAGYWGRMRAGYIYVPSHYRWTPFGYVFVAGYYDLDVPRRGVLYAPVVVDVAVVGPRFVYTPYYAVSDTIVLDAMFVRPAYCHYYFGDYYGPRYRTLGFETTIVYSRRCYDPVIVYRRWEYRDNPRWFDAQVTLVVARDNGRAWVPPRTLVQQNTIIQNNVNVTNITNVNNVTNNTVLAPTKNVVAARGNKVVALDNTTRAQVQQSSQKVSQAAVRERQLTEKPGGPNNLDAHKPKVASYTPPPSAPAIPQTGGLPKGPANTGNPQIGGNTLKGPSPGTAQGNPLAPTGNPIITGKGSSNPVYQPGQNPNQTSNPGLGKGPINPVVRPGQNPKTPPPSTKRDDRKKGPP